MKGILETFEVRVRSNGGTGMFHYEARNGKKAKMRARKHGQPYSARKVDYSEIFGNIEKLDLRQDPLYETAIGMETIGMMEANRAKRIDRRNNLQKDKIEP